MRAWKKAFVPLTVVLSVFLLSAVFAGSVTDNDIARIKAKVEAREMLSPEEVRLAEQINATTGSRIDIVHAQALAKLRQAGIEEPASRPPRNPLDEYVWSPTTFDWVDISQNGTDTGLNSDDQNLGPFNIGFNFSFYNQNFGSVRICSNGWLSFTSTSTVYVETAIPNPAEPNNAIYGFWDDLTASGGWVKYYYDQANGRFIVTWHTRRLAGTQIFDHQIILYNNGDIKIQWQTIPELVNSCTVGIENATGTEGVQVCFDGQGTMPAAQTAILINQPNGMPNPPTNLQAQVNGANVTLTWVNPTQDTNGNPITPDSTQVWLGAPPSGQLLLNVAGRPTTYTHVNAPSGQLTYYVRSHNAQWWGAPASVTAIVGNPAYQSNFDTDNGQWVAVNGLWEWGAPVATQPRSAPNVWGTATLSGTYPNNACNHLELDLGLTVVSPTATVEFYYWCWIESFWDGCNFQASTDGGSTWQVMVPSEGAYTQQSANNTCIGQNPNWSGQSNGWIRTVIPVGSLLGTTPKFRFTFGTDASVTYAGFLFDDMIIWGLTPPEFATVSGTVTLNGGSGNVTQVLIRSNGVGSPSTNPAANGAYTLNNVQVGPRIIHIELNGYVTQDNPLNVPQGGIQNYNIMLNRVPPPAPTGLTASINNSNGVVTLDWNDSPDPQVDRYYVYRRERGQDNWTFVSSVIPSNATTQAPGAGIWQYTVTAVDSIGPIEPVQSDYPRFVEVIYGEIPPVGLRANGRFDNRIRLTWREPGANPAPPYQIFYDDSTSEVWFRVQTPNGQQDYFAVRFTPPPPDSTSYPLPVALCLIYMERNDPLPNVWLARNVGGAPDLTNPMQNWQNIGADGTPGWIRATVDEGIVLEDNSDFWVVWQFPPGLTGPGTGSDNSAPNSRSYWTLNAGQVWNLWTTYDWMARVWVGGVPSQGLLAGTTQSPGFWLLPSGETASNWDDLGKYPAGSARGPAIQPIPPVLSPLTAIGHQAGAFSSVIPTGFSDRLAGASNGRGRRSLDDVTHYRIYRDGSQVAQVPATILTYDDMPLAENIPHVYWVTALYDNGQESGPSNRDTMACNMAPAAPANVNGQSVNAQQIRITWTDPTTNADGSNCVDLTTLRIYRDGVFIGSVGPGVGQYIDTPPNPMQTYVWGVTAQDEVPNESTPGTFTGSVVSPWMETGYDWVDISQNGINTGLTGDDQTVGPFNLGFPFTFYGNTYNQVWVCSNGWITFVSTTSAVYTNTQLPNPAVPNAVLYPMWDDLYLPSGGQVRYRAEAGRFIVSWLAVPHIGGQGPYTFQVIINSDGGVVFNYQTWAGNTSSTVGVENATGTMAIQLCFDGQGIWCPTDQSAVQFWGSPPTYANVSGNVALDGGSGTITNVLVRANGVSNPTTNPNAQGAYTLQDVQVGNRIISASLAGYRTDTLHRNVPEGGLTNVNLVLRRLDPPQPTGLTATVNSANGIVTLNWDDSPDLLVDGYRLYRKLHDDQTWTLRHTVWNRTHSFDADTLPSDGIYDYQVSAIDTNVTPPAVESPRSATVTVLYGELPPNFLRANGNFDNKIRLTWREPGAAPPPYQIFYDDSTSEVWFRVQTPNGQQDYFAVRFTPPSADTTNYPLPVALCMIYMERSDPLPNVWLAEDVGGAPDLNNPLQNWQDIGADGTPGWIRAETAPGVQLENDDDFWVVWQFPPGLTGPGTGSDNSAPDSRSYWTLNGGSVWNLWTTYDWMARVWVGSMPEGILSNSGAPAAGHLLLPSGQTVPTAEELEKYRQLGMERGPLANPVTSAARGNKTARRSATAFESVVPTGFPEGGTLSSRNSGRGRRSLDDVTHYRIYRNNQQIAQVPANILQYDDTPLPENVPYIYHVTALYDNGQESGPSNRDTAACNMAPGRVTGLSGQLIGQTQMRLTWGDPTTNADGTPCVDLAGIRVYRGTQLLTTLPPGTETYTDGPLTPGQFYSWYLRAIDEVPNVGPDAVYGYPWIDISDIGQNTGLTGDDQIVGPFDLGFDFPYYGQNYTQIWVCSNGFATVLSGQPAVYTNVTIPNSATPNGILCPFWDDLMATTPGRVLYYSDPDAGRFVISWLNVPHFGGGGNETFQIVLTQRGGVTFTYYDVQNNTSCTVGVENESGTEGIQSFYNGAGDFTPVTFSTISYWGGPSGELTGVVRAFQNNQFIQNCRVFAVGGPDTAYTDAQGQYELPLDPGTYTITFRHPQYCDTSFTGIVIEDNSTTTRNAVLRWPQASFSATSINMLTWEGHDVAQTLTISNQGGNCPLSFTITDTSAWLETVPSQGVINPGQGLDVQVIAHVQGMPPGTNRNSNLRITFNAAGSPRNIPVFLAISVPVDDRLLGLPTAYAYHQNHPNPFNAMTALRFDLPQESRVDLVVFNVMGQEVARPVSTVYPAGRHQVMFDAGALPSGMYIVRMTAGEFKATSKMLLMK